MKTRKPIKPSPRGWVCPVCGAGVNPYTMVCPCGGAMPPKTHEIQWMPMPTYTPYPNEWTIPWPPQGPMCVTETTTPIICQVRGEDS